MKRRVIAGVVAALLLIIIAVVVIVSRQRVRRHRYFRAAPAEKPAAAPIALGPIEQWSGQFRALEVSGRWGDLAKLLEEPAKKYPPLQYLRARALIENNQPDAAIQALAPFLANGNPFRDLALFHRAEIEEGDPASRDRQALIFGFASSLYRDQAIDDEIEYLTRRADVNAFVAFSSRIHVSAPTARRRDLDAHLVELFVQRGEAGNALQKGLALLRGGTLDDPADLVSRTLDHPELIRRMAADQQAMLGEAFHNHRHFDRAVALLSLALSGAPRSSAARPPGTAALHRDQLQFAIGRAYFGDEKYAQAQQAFMAGANSTRDPKWKARFLFHASRAAQLRGDDIAAERLMTATLSVPALTEDHSSALTQRIRTRLKQHRFAEARRDLAVVRKNFPRQHALVEASLAYAIGMLGAGNSGAAIVTLNSIPHNLLDKFEPSE
ncbi:MAG: hypothetical protein DMF58_05745, partial [Acidobacteria bacterium]